MLFRATDMQTRTVQVWTHVVLSLGFYNVFN